MIGNLSSQLKGTVVKTKHFKTGKGDLISGSSLGHGEQSDLAVYQL
jgi:hypothetical protein